MVLCVSGSTQHKDIFHSEREAFCVVVEDLLCLFYQKTANNIVFVRHLGVFCVPYDELNKVSFGVHTHREVCEKCAEVGDSFHFSSLA